VLGSHLVPGGTEVAATAGLYPMGTSKEFRGADAELFRPERWLEVDADRLQSMVAAVELDFGGGQYQCLARGPNAINGGEQGVNRAFEAV